MGGRCMSQWVAERVDVIMRGWIDGWVDGSLGRPIN